MQTLKKSRNNLSINGQLFKTKLLIEKLLRRWTGLIKLSGAEVCSHRRKCLQTLGLVTTARLEPAPAKHIHTAKRRYILCFVALVVDLPGLDAAKDSVKSTYRYTMKN